VRIGNLSWGADRRHYFSASSDLPRHSPDYVFMLDTDPQLISELPVPARPLVDRAYAAIYTPPCTRVATISKV
jgi:hypothetical protein